MKKAILFFAAIAIAGTASAQTNKQVAGSNSLEVQFSPLNGNPVSLDGGVRFRMFSSETTAFRGTVFLGGGSTSDKSEQTFFEGTDDEKVLELTDKTSNFSIQLRPGLEWHLVGTDKLSPYYGAEALIGFRTEKTVSEGGEFNDDFTDVDVAENSESQGTTQFGVNAVAGFDYYFAQNIYFGAEMGAGILYESMGATKFESTFDGVDATETPGGSALTGGPNVNGRIRLGIIF